LEGVVRSVLNDKGFGEFATWFGISGARARQAILRGGREVRAMGIRIFFFFYNNKNKN